MALKTLLVCLTSRETAEAAMKAAVPLARAQQAHLIGLHTLEAILVYPGIALHLPGSSFSSFNHRQDAEAVEIETIFRKYTENEDFPSEWRLLKAESTTASARIIDCARAADLVVMAKDEANSAQWDQDTVQAQVIRQSGRPVIIVPPGYEGSTIGDNIVLGWSNTREATRAAHDVLTLFSNDSKVSIVRVDHGGGREMEDYAIIDLAAAFDRHGVSAIVSHLDGSGNDVSAVLLRHAFEQGADLIATGAFGHSRFYDFVNGAVTQALLRDAELPVLFSR